MDNEVVKLLLEYSIKEWENLPIVHKPWGVWIVLHCPVKEDVTRVSIKTPVEKVWFLNNEGIKKESVWKYWRFYTIHFEQPWCKRPYGETDKVFGEPHYIGFVKFANVGNTDNLSIETFWAGKFGRGVWVKIEDNSLYIIRDLWVS